MLEESNEKEIELEKFQNILRQSHLMESKSKLFQFLKEQNESIFVLQSKIHLPMSKVESAKSFLFLQALILFFFHSGIETDKKANLVELVKIISTGCQKLPRCSIDELRLFLHNFADQLKREGSLSELLLVESLIDEIHQ